MKISVIGAGSWGTAVASLLTWNGHDVVMWARSNEIAAEINVEHTNNTYLPGINLPAALSATHDPEEALSGTELIVIGIPAQASREILSELAPFLDSLRKSLVPVVSLVKGVEKGSSARISTIISETWGIAPDHIAILSGPNHAEEVIRRVPSATVIAGNKLSLIEPLQNVFMNKMFRVYVNTDTTGVELCGATKNVIAIAAGISDGLRYGDNTKATLLTRGLAEMTRLGLAMGASPHTFAGLAGIGDLIATCTSPHSRNRRVGEEIGKGRSLADILASTRMVAEGVDTSSSLAHMADIYAVELPIMHEVYSVLHAGKSPVVSVDSLMSRDPAAEGVS